MEDNSSFIFQADNSDNGRDCESGVFFSKNSMDIHEPPKILTLQSFGKYFSRKNLYKKYAGILVIAINLIVIFIFLIAFHSSIQTIDSKFITIKNSIEQFYQNFNSLEENLNHVNIKLEFLNESRDQLVQSIGVMETNLYNEVEMTRQNLTDKTQGLNSSHHEWRQTFHENFERLFQKPRNCLDIQKNGRNMSQLSSKIYTIYPFGLPLKNVSVRCDFQTDGGGWTIIQQRTSGPLTQFYVNWFEYEEGFGALNSSYWLGLKTIWILTSSGRAQQLRIDLEDWDGTKKWAEYSFFAIGSIDDFYRLKIGGYSGTAGDSLIDQHQGMPFSTWDRDNDKTGDNCAQKFHGGWWYNTCHMSNLNGYYRSRGEATPFGDGVNWYSWKGYEHSLKTVSMKIRDA